MFSPVRCSSFRLPDCFRQRINQLLTDGLVDEYFDIAVRLERQGETDHIVVVAHDNTAVIP